MFGFFWKYCMVVLLIFKYRVIESYIPFRNLPSKTNCRHIYLYNIFGRRICVNPMLQNKLELYELQNSDNADDDDDKLSEDTLRLIKESQPNQIDVMKDVRTIMSCVFFYVLYIFSCEVF